MLGGAAVWAQGSPPAGKLLSLDSLLPASVGVMECGGEMLPAWEAYGRPATALDISAANLPRSSVSWASPGSRSWSSTGTSHQLLHSSLRALPGGPESGAGFGSGDFLGQPPDGGAASFAENALVQRLEAQKSVLERMLFEAQRELTTRSAEDALLRCSHAAEQQELRAALDLSFHEAGRIRDAELEAMRRSEARRTETEATMRAELASELRLARADAARAKAEVTELQVQGSEALERSLQAAFRVAGTEAEWLRQEAARAVEREAANWAVEREGLVERLVEGREAAELQRRDFSTARARLVEELSELAFAQAEERAQFLSARHAGAEKEELLRAELAAEVAEARAAAARAEANKELHMSGAKALQESLRCLDAESAQVAQLTREAAGLVLGRAQLVEEVQALQSAAELRRLAFAAERSLLEQDLAELVQGRAAERTKQLSEGRASDSGEEMLHLHVAESEREQGCRAREPPSAAAVAAEGVQQEGHTGMAACAREVLPASQPREAKEAGHWSLAVVKEEWRCEVAGLHASLQQAAAASHTEAAHIQVLELGRRRAEVEVEHAWREIAELKGQLQSGAAAADVPAVAWQPYGDGYQRNVAKGSLSGGQTSRLLTKARAAALVKVLQEKLPGHSEPDRPAAVAIAESGVEASACPEQAAAAPFLSGEGAAGTNSRLYLFPEAVRMHSDVQAFHMAAEIVQAASASRDEAIDELRAQVHVLSSELQERMVGEQQARGAPGVQQSLAASHRSCLQEVAGPQKGPTSVVTDESRHLNVVHTQQIAAPATLGTSTGQLSALCIESNQAMMHKLKDEVTALRRLFAQQKTEEASIPAEYTLAEAHTVCAAVASAVATAAFMDYEEPHKAMPAITTLPIRELLPQSHMRQRSVSRIRSLSPISQHNAAVHLPLGAGRPISSVTLSSRHRTPVSTAATPLQASLQGSRPAELGTRVRAGEQSTRSVIVRASGAMQHTALLSASPSAEVTPSTPALPPPAHLHQPSSASSGARWPLPPQPTGPYHCSLHMSSNAQQSLMQQQCYQPVPVVHKNQQSPRAHSPMHSAPKADVQSPGPDLGRHLLRRMAL